MPTYTTTEPITATLEVAGARVRITATDRPDTVVRVEPIDPANPKHAKVAERTEVALAGGRLSVKTRTSGERDGSVDIVIDLPTGSPLALFLAHSTVHADGGLGDCTLHMASGRVELDRIAGLAADVAAGDVAIREIGGAATINGARFDLGVDEVGGPVHLRSSGGVVRIDHAAAAVDLSSGRCEVELNRADGDVTVETASGGVRIGRVSQGQVRVRNGSGDIEIGVAERSAVAVDAHSERGAVRDFATTSGAVAAAAPRVSVHVRTRHGDVTVERVAG